MTKKDNEPFRPVIETGVVCGDLLRGLGAIMEGFIQALDENGNEITKSGEFLLEKTNSLSGLYGISVKANEKGLPKIERFGTLPGSDLREPIVDVFDEEKTIRIIAEMPGIEEEDIITELKETFLILRAEREGRRFAAEIPLPALVKETITVTCRTGLVEIELEKETPCSSSGLN